ncbi:hypothetical protein ACP70R_032384 [Stipagrostis hirtigluma subsp. patula]
MELEAANSFQGIHRSPTPYYDDLSQFFAEDYNTVGLLGDIAGTIQPGPNRAGVIDSSPGAFIHQPGQYVAGDAGLQQLGPYGGDAGLHQQVSDAAGDAGLHQLAPCVAGDAGLPPPGPHPPAGDAGPSATAKIASHQCFGSLGVNADLLPPATGTDVVARLENYAQPQFTSSIAQPHPYPGLYAVNGQGASNFNTLDANSGLTHPGTGKEIPSMGVDVGPSNTASTPIRSHRFKNVGALTKAALLDGDQKAISSFREFWEKWPKPVLEVIPEKDPWQVESCTHIYVRVPSSMETPGGKWKEKQNSFTAIRGSPGDSQRYIGAKKTYEFQEHDGSTKTKESQWFMDEYYLLDPRRNGPGLVIQEDMVLRRIFCKDKVEVSNTVLPLKRKPCVPSGAWAHFTQIYSNKDDKLVNAVCHDCDRIFCAEHKKHGTKSLQRHHNTCSSSAKASISSQSRSMQPSSC